MADPERVAAGKARLKACKACATSFYVAIMAAIVWFLFAPLFGAIAGFVAVGFGVWGRLSLARLGRSDALRNKDAAPIERVAARMQKGAERQGMLGPLIGGFFVAWYLIVLAVVLASSS